jgi:GTPase SAR1 family protein
MCCLSVFVLVVNESLFIKKKNYDYSFKIQLIGDSGVGKSSFLLSFISDFVHDLSPTIGPLCLSVCLSSSTVIACFV